MFCPQCGKPNRDASRFCRFCGTRLSSIRAFKTLKGTLPEPQEFKYSIFKKAKDITLPILRRAIPHSKKSAIVAAVIILFVASSALAAPKVIDYVEVKNIEKKARELSAVKEYKAAIEKLDEVRDRWIPKSKKTAIQEFREQQVKFADHKDKYQTALSKEEKGEFKEARDILSSIPSDSPLAADTDKKKTELQEKIESKLRSDLSAKEEELGRVAGARIEAEKKAAAESAAKAQAEAQKRAAEEQARASADAKARADATAEAERKAALEAEQKRQREEQQRLRQVRVSFYNQIQTIDSAISDDGIGYYNRAMDLYNSDNMLSALAIFGQARAIFSKANDDAASLIAQFSGLPADYNAAAYNAKNAANACYQAADEMMSAIANDTYSYLASSFGNSCDSYRSYVRSFLLSTNP